MTDFVVISREPETGAFHVEMTTIGPLNAVQSPRLRHVMGDVVGKLEGHKDTVFVSVDGHPVIQEVILEPAA